jgi:hypothetical protein
MPFPANPLETALAGLRAGTVSADQLLEALGSNPLWVPLPAGADPRGEAQLPVMVLDGRPYVAAYTSAEQYARGAGAQAHMELAGKQLAGLMADELGLAVNPGAELGLPVHTDGVRTIRGGRRDVPAGSRMRLGAPADEPHQLITTLTRTFAGTPAVLEARRALAQIGGEPPTLLIGVRPDRHVDTWQQDSIAAVTDAVRQTPIEYGVDTVFLDEQADPVTAWMLAHTEPFYRRAATAPT